MAGHRDLLLRMEDTERSEPTEQYSVVGQAVARASGQRAGCGGTVLAAGRRGDRRAPADLPRPIGDRARARRALGVEAAVGGCRGTGAQQAEPAYPAA